MSITVEGVSHYYGSLEILKDINLTFEASRDNLYCLDLQGVGNPPYCAYWVGWNNQPKGRVLQSHTPHSEALIDIAYVFQDYSLLPWSTVEGNIQLALEPHNLSDEETLYRINNVLERNASSPNSVQLFQNSCLGECDNEFLLLEP